MTDIVVRTTLNGAPVNGLTDDPEITIQRVDTGAAVVTDDAMTDTGVEGAYTYSFQGVAGLRYSFIVDADPSATGQVDERYYDGAFDNELNDVWRDQGLDPANAKTVDDNNVPGNADIDEDVAAVGGDSPTIHKDVITAGDVTTITRT